MRIRNPKIKRALMTGMACLSTVIAVLSFTLKLPQAFLDGQNSLSVLAAGLTAPDGARNLFAQRAPENTEAQSQLGQETAGSQLLSRRRAAPQPVRPLRHHPLRPPVLKALHPPSRKNPVKTPRIPAGKCPIPAALWRKERRPIRSMRCRSVPAELNMRISASKAPARPKSILERNWRKGPM